MAKQKFSVTLPDGNIATRSTERAYTHVVIGRRDLDAARAAQANAASRKFHAANYLHYVATIAAGVGGQVSGCHYTVTARYFEEAKQAIRDTKDEADYIEREIVRCIARINDAYGTGSRSAWIALQWSMNERNAMKGAQSNAKYYVDVQVVPVDAK
ncbi:MAG: hypothetical protein ACTHKB_08205 [Burkholderiaceae bacterium]